MLFMKMYDVFCVLFLVAVAMNVHVSCQFGDVVDNIKSSAMCLTDFTDLAAKGLINQHDCGKYLAFENTCKDEDKDQTAKYYKELRDPKTGYKEKCGCAHTIMNIALGFACLLIALFHNTGISNMRNV